MYTITYAPAAKEGLAKLKRSEFVEPRSKTDRQVLDSTSPKRHITTFGGLLSTVNCKP